MTPISERLDKLGLSSKYEEVDSSAYPLVVLRDLDRGLEFCVQWKTFRRFCLIPGYKFSATTGKGRVTLWQRKLDAAAPGRFRVNSTKLVVKKLKLEVHDSLSDETYTVGAYYLLGKIRLDPDYVFRQGKITVNGGPIPEIASLTGYSRAYLYPLYHKHGREFIENLLISGHRRRPEYTAIEIKIRDLLEGKDFIHNKVLPGTSYRPDFFLPDRSVIIECDGLFWHSDRFLNKAYHREKQRAYAAMGIRGLFFREDEINQKYSVVRSILENALGSSSVRVFARKTQVRKGINPLFFSSNHLMGKGQGRTYGLEYLGDVVASIQVKWINKNEKSLDISRFCTTPGVSVVGGFSKLISAVIAEEKPSTVRTFIDLRYGKGKYLSRLGWKCRGESLSFRWTNGTKAWHRLRFKGNSGYEKGLYKIWDCGQAKWVLEV